MMAVGGGGPRLQSKNTACSCAARLAVCRLPGRADRGQGGQPPSRGQSAGTPTSCNDLSVEQLHAVALGGHQVWCITKKLGTRAGKLQLTA